MHVKDLYICVINNLVVSEIYCEYISVNINGFMSVSSIIIILSFI